MGCRVALIQSAHGEQHPIGEGFWPTARFRLACELVCLVCEVTPFTLRHDTGDSGALFGHAGFAPGITEQPFAHCLFMTVDCRHWISLCCFQWLCSHSADGGGFFLRLPQGSYITCPSWRTRLPGAQLPGSR